MSTLNTTLNTTGSQSYGGTSVTWDASQGGWYTSPITTSGSWTILNPTYTFSTPVQVVIFNIDEKTKYSKDEEMFISRFEDISENQIHFTPIRIGNKVEPIELIMKYIKNQRKMDIKIVRDGYDITLKGVIFKSIKNFMSKTSMTTIKVVIEYDSLDYDNTLLSLEEKRGMKIKQLTQKITKDDI